MFKIHLKSKNHKQLIITEDYLVKNSIEILRDKKLTIEEQLAKHPKIKKLINKNNLYARITR